MKLRFTIRDLFWLVLVAALAAAWWSDRRSLEPYRKLWEDQQQHDRRLQQIRFNGYPPGTY
jgi:hypothetical protein